MDKVLHVTPEANFAIKFVLPIIESDKTNKYEYSIVTSFGDYKNEKIRREILLSKSQLKSHIKIFSLKILKNPFNAIWNLLMFGIYLKRQNFKIIVFHTSIDSFFPLFIARKITNSKLIYFNHGVPYLGYTSLVRYILKFIESSNIKNSDTVITVSSSMKNVLSLLNINKKEINFIPPGSACGIDIQINNYEDLIKSRLNSRLMMGIPTNYIIFTYIGRAEKRKGLYNLIEAWNKFNETQVYLFIVGPDKSLIKNYVSDNKNVTTFGYLNDVTSIYLASDYLIIPSNHEGFGYCYLEAANHGCIPICCNIPGPTDFVKHFQNGFHLKSPMPNDIHELLYFLTKHLGEHEREQISYNAFMSSLLFDRRVIAPSIFNKITAEE